MSPRRAARPARPSVRRHAWAGLAVAALVVPLAACSGGGDDVQAFCDQGEDAIAEVDAAGSLGSDPEAFAQAISDAREGFESVEAPAEIEDDWAVFTRTFGDLDDALQDIDATDQEAFTAALQEFAETADSEDLSTAGDNLSTFITENCDA
ncbi:hypothetical protein [Cellulomonas sp. Marseille-Q8402]